MKWWMVLVLAGCQARTELIVGIATDLHATDQLHHVQLQVLIEGTPIGGLGDTWEVTGPGSSGVNLPASYGIYSDGDEQQVELLVTGYQDGKADPVVTRDAIVTLVGGETLFYRMGITASCAEVGCTNGQTCIEGVCRDVALDSHDFPEYDSTLVTTLTCNSGTPYIDTSTDMPMQASSDAAACPKGLCQEGTCLVPPDTQDLSLDALASAYGKAYCPKLFDCCTAAEIPDESSGAFTDEASCEAYYTDDLGPYLAQLQAEIAAGGLIYRADLAGACVAAISRESCAAAFNAGEDSSCDGVFQGTGTIADGGPCDGDETECLGGYCNYNGTTMTGVCGEAASNGQACESGTADDVPCKSGLYCDFTDTTCHPYVTLGQMCGAAECGSGLYCAASGICAALVSNGGSCVEDDQCANFHCTSNDDTTPGTCFVDQPVGASCLEDDDCASDHCAGAVGTTPGTCVDICAGSASR